MQHMKIIISITRCRLLPDWQPIWLHVLPGKRSAVGPFAARPGTNCPG